MEESQNIGDTFLEEKFILGPTLGFITKLNARPVC
jgi:hypothetical protein